MIQFCFGPILSYNQINGMFFLTINKKVLKFGEMFRLRTMVEQKTDAILRGTEVVDILNMT